MPVPRVRSPWIAVQTHPFVRLALSLSEVRFHDAPGDGTPSSFNFAAIHRGDFPPANQLNMRRTTSACSTCISRWPDVVSRAAM